MQNKLHLAKVRLASLEHMSKTTDAGEQNASLIEHHHEVVAEILILYITRNYLQAVAIDIKYDDQSKMIHATIFAAELCAK